MKTGKPYYLFVYGTLRKAVENPVKKEIINDVEWMGKSEIQGKMYDIGWYPGALPVTDRKTCIIIGEILKMKHPKKVLRILDDYEGFNPNERGKSEYYREQEKINLPDGKEIQAWVYWYNFSVKGKKRIWHKDYLDYLKKKKSA